jgi:Flp pilus assembly protein TadD
MTDTQLPVRYRIANALLSYVHYLIQTFWPRHYAVFYPYPRGFSVVAVCLAILLLLGVTSLAFVLRRTRPYVAFGWVWYLATLLPVIGLIQVGSQAHADRYTYVPLIGIFVALVWGVYDLTRGWRFQVPALGAAGAAVCLLCVGFTREQVWYWRNSETLARRAIEVAPNNPVAENILGIGLMNQGRVDEAIPHFERATQLASRYAMAQGNLGSAFFIKGRWDESIKHSREAIKLQPDLAGAYQNLGSALGAQGHLDEAIVQLKQAVKLDPADPQGHYNLAYACQSKGRLDEAIAQYREAARLAPGNQEVQKALQAALAAKGVANKDGGTQRGKPQPK